MDNKALYDTFSLFGNILSCKATVGGDRVGEVVRAEDWGGEGGTLEAKAKCGRGVQDDQGFYLLEVPFGPTEQTWVYF